MKLRSCFLLLVLMGLAACAKPPAPSASTSQAAQALSPASPNRGRGVLTREEVTAILGAPVTSMEGTASDMEYKTDTVGLETVVGIETEQDSGEAMAGARKATAMLGGSPQDLPNVGDEAFFGAMSILYVRKGDSVITITPPNFQQIAAMAAYNKVAAAPLGSQEQLQALQNFQKVEKHDPLKAGLASPDAAQGALAVIATVSRKQGTPEEEHGRAVALALGSKVVSKL